MDHILLGLGVCGQSVDDPYVITFSLMLNSPSDLSPLLPVLLVFRIWHVDRMAKRLSASHRRSQLRPILHILVDAGLIYSVTLLVALICFVCQSNGQYVMLDLVSPSCLAS